MMRKSLKDSGASVGVLLLIFIGHASGNKEGYFGKYVGKLSQLHHGVSGDVFAVDARTLHIRNFNYDGEGPAAYFYAGNSKAPGVDGFRVRDERGTTNVLPRYRNRHITITLPEGKTLQNIRWFSVWCDEFSVNFGDVKIPKNLDFPKPQKISGLSGVHGVSSEPIVIVDAQTLLIPSFSYDGEAPDAKFWVGRGFKPSPQGIRIPDENGKELPLRRYDRKTIVLTLPGDLTIFDIGHFGVWCEAFTVDFGHVQIPRGLNIPPSLKMLGVSPQSKLNCEVLWDDFAYEVRWAVAGDSIVLQLVARLENSEYMSFGLSGDRTRSRMVGGDVVVAWVDKESLRGFAKDYYLDAKSQCSGGRGSCPDENIQSGTESVRLLNAALVNGYSIVTFQRSLKARDDLDKEVFTNRSQPVIWAIGPLNSRKEVSYHSLANRGDIFIDFGRAPKWNCPTPESVPEEADPQDSPSFSRQPEEPIIPPAAVTQDSARRESRPKAQIPTPAPAPKSGAWEIPPIKCHEPEDGVFYAQMGPTGGKHGYSAITGHVGWGISWYINGLLIPEINVVRGRTYTFIVEGGLDPETPARYHPFYITDDPVGGYQYKTPEERANIQIFAGAVQNKRGEVRPTGVGRLCNWTPDPNAPPADEFTSFGAYQRTLRLECDPGNPGIIQWTVEKDTPDTVYYQCYTHRYLGWKIRVHDHCEGEAASDPVPSVVKAPPSVLKSYAMDSEPSESIYHETRVKPDADFRPNRTFLAANEFAGLHREKPDDRRNVFGAKTGNVKLRPEGPVPQDRSPNIPLPTFLPGNAIAPPKSSGYSVSEEPSEANFPENIGLVLIPHPDESLHSFGGAPKPHHQDHTPTGSRLREEAKNNHPIVRVEDKPKRNNHKPPFGKPKLPNGVNRLHKPQPYHSPAFSLPHSPLKPPKRPVSLVPLKAPHHAPPKIPHRINVALSPENLHSHQIKLPGKKHHSPALYAPDLFGSFTAGKPLAQSILFAQNGGFDPDSVQVEGGFKPILNTGVASRASPGLIDRAAVEVPEEADDAVGVVELAREDASAGKEVQSTKEEDVDLFKNQKPEIFEPIFIPSHPDDSVKKQDEYRKKPLLRIKPRYDRFERKDETNVKNTPTDDVQRTDNIVPSLRVPQARTSTAGEADATPGGPATTQERTSETPRAENIMDVIEMYEGEAKNSTGVVSEGKFKREDEIPVADEKKDYYLPPKAEFLSYDGKVVKAVEAPALPQASPPADISKLPQFVPFKGAIPPLAHIVNAKNLPQLASTHLAREDILPPAALRSFPGDRPRERRRRSPDHIPGHEGHDHHDHDHDHHHHHHSGGSRRATNLLLIASISIAALCRLQTCA